MFIAGGAQESLSRGILAYMPSALRKYMYRINFDEAYEIRLNIGQPVMIYYSDGCYYLNSTGVLTKSLTGAVRVTRSHIDEALEIATKSSVYAKQDCISRGYITVEGGHRIGIAGTAVMKEDKVTFINDISTLNYRLAYEVKGVADRLIEKIYNGGNIKNTLLISPPGAGKTTMLRDIIRQLSEKGLRVSVVDERSEISAMRDGKTSFDLGIHTDVLEGVPKPVGIQMLLRSMSPQVIALDEIGTAEDFRAIEEATKCGVKIISTIHGFGVEDAKNRAKMQNIEMNFEMFVILRRNPQTMEFEYETAESEC